MKSPGSRFVPFLIHSCALLGVIVPVAGSEPAQGTDAMVIPIVVQPPEGYPGNPSPLLTPLRQDLSELRLQRRADGLYDLALGPGPEGPSLTAIDLRSFIPRIPDLAREDETLMRIALAQREFNRNEVSFGAVQGADDLKLANNCLRSGLWEIMLAKKVDGTSKLSFHGWFTFPAQEYAKLFEEVNGLPWSRFADQMSAYPAMGGFAVPLGALRSETRAGRIKGTPGGGIVAAGAEPSLRFGEQARKAKLVLTEGLATYADFQKKPVQPVSMARFSEPGYYDPANPARFDLGWISNPESASRRSVKARRDGQAMTEISVEFSNGYRLVIADESIAGLPARTDPPRADADVLRLTFGISTPEISLPVAERLSEFRKPRSNYLFLLDRKGRAVDNHQAGVDRLFLWRESGGSGGDRLHLLLVGYERIAIVGEIVLPWKSESPPVEPH